MRRIKMDNLKTNQTVFAFACPCASCSTSYSCDCKSQGVSANSWSVVVHQSYNRSIGGSMVGGGG